MAHSPDHSLAPSSAAPPAVPSGIPSGVPAAPRLLSSIPASELPPLTPHPTSDPYSPVAAGQALFCAVFNVTFSTLTAWLASVPQHLITQVRQSFASHSSHSSPPSSPSSPSHPSYPSLSERILLACRAFYRLLRIRNTFRCGAWAYLSPRQLGLLSRAAGAIKAFSGRSFDFSWWADLGRRPARSYFSSSSVAPSPALPLAPSSSPHPPIRNPQSQIRNPFPEWPFTEATACNAPFVTSPGSVLAQVCRDLARLTESPSPSELESPSPSHSELALTSQSTPSIASMGSIGSMGSIPSIPTPSTLDIGHLTLDSLRPLSLANPATDRLVLYPGPLYSYPHILRPPYLTPPGRPPFYPYRPAPPVHPAHPPPP